MDVVKVALVGFGRIGQVHFENLNKHIKNLQVIIIADPYIDKLSNKCNLNKGNSKLVLLENWQQIFNSDLINKIDAVIIATPAMLHIELIEISLKYNKHVFCEKPVSRSLEKLLPLNEKVKYSSSIVSIGLNRRYDPGVQELKSILNNQYHPKDISCIKITSRDPGLPPYEYIKDSGGIYFDMIIHDFDMASYLMNKKVRSVYSCASIMIDQKLKDYDDYDTVITNIIFEDESVAIIDNSREASYGYDQRIEVFTNNNKLETVNIKENNLRVLNSAGGNTAKLKHFFLERYQQSYVNEMIRWYENIINKNVINDLDSVVTAVKIAETAVRSNKLSMVVEV